MDSMKLTILGTGNAMVTECYNTCFALSAGERHFLIDGGGGNTLLKQLKLANIDWKNVRDIFVTHKHIDHILGIVWMVRLICQNMSRNNYEGEATIYGHDEVIALIRELSQRLIQAKAGAFLDKRLHLVTVSDGESRQILDKKVTFFDIRSTKAKQFGFTMDIGAGKKLTCCGDEPYTESERPYVENSKWLLHEAFCLHSQADIFKPYEKNHSTVKDACELAQSLNVENLILYHTEDRNIAERKKLYSEEGLRYYRGNLFIPNDLETFQL